MLVKRRKNLHTRNQKLAISAFLCFSFFGGQNEEVCDNFFIIAYMLVPAHKSRAQ